MLKQPEQVIFDPENKEHVAAFYLMATQGKSSNLRFELEHPFRSTFDMARHKLAMKYSSMVLNKEDTNEETNLIATPLEEFQFSKEINPRSSNTVVPINSVISRNKRKLFERS